MIRKAGHILIILVLLFGTTGLTITRHYCGSNLIHTVIYSTPEKCCEGDCPGCHDEKISFRITDQFESTQTLTNFNAGFQTLLEKSSLPVVLAFSNLPEGYLFNDGPGGHRLKPSFILPIIAGRPSSILQVFLF